MKRVEAFIQPHRLSKVVRALHELPSFTGFTVVGGKGQGHGRGTGGHYAFGNDSLMYQDRQVLVVICTDTDADLIARTIAKAAHTHNPGDGLVSIGDVSQVLRIADAHAQGGEPQ